MGSSDRKPYETAVAITQDFLDECAGNLVNQLELVVDIQAPVTATYDTAPGPSSITIYSEAHGISIGSSVELIDADFPSAAGTYTVLITGYGTDYFSINIGAPVLPTSGAVKYIGYLRLSDRNKYVGPKYYEARLVFPTISRTIGELLSPTLEFSTLQLEINNADGKFNYLMPAGSDYGAWPGSRVEVALGLRDVESTYIPIFSGEVTHEGGFQRSLKSFSLTVRNDFDKLNTSELPVRVFNQDDYPNLESDKVNLAIPIIYGDWTVDVEAGMASVPAYVVNETDIAVTGEGSPHSSNIKCVISDNDLSFFDTTQVYIKRSDVVQVFDVADIVNVGAGNKSFEIRQSGTTPLGVTLIEGVAYAYERGDEIYVKVKGKDLGAYDNNPVAQARDILETYADVSPSLFDANWNTYRGKSSPPQSAIVSAKCRCWIHDTTGALQYALSILEQVRLEAFISLEGKIKLSSLHFEDFDASPAFEVHNWDIEEGSFKPQLDIRNNFNRAQGVFNYLPNRNENYQSTKILKNTLAIDAIGKEVSKRVVYPNLHDEAFVVYQLTETLRLLSGYPEIIDVTLTWRALRKDIGDFIIFNVSIGSVIFAGTPALIREIGYDPDGLKITVRALSFQMIPFTGWNPGTNGITGGYNAIIIEE